MRLYLNQKLVPGVSLDVSGAAAHHALRVMRIKSGETLTLFNGHGGEYNAVVIACGKQTLSLEVGEWCDIERESPIEVSLIQALSTGDKMDYTIQKAVELGVSTIIPVLSERSVVRLNQERAAKRRQHWQGVVLAACEQCGRNRIPRIEPLANLRDCLQQDKTDSLRWLLSPTADDAMSRQPVPSKPLRLLIGPEAGFSQAEHELAAAHGYVAMRLGSRVLRTETAALAAFAAIQALWGEF